MYSILSQHPIFPELNDTLPDVIEYSFIPDIIDALI